MRLTPEREKEIRESECLNCNGCDFRAKELLDEINALKIDYGNSLFDSAEALKDLRSELDTAIAGRLAMEGQIKSLINENINLIERIEKLKKTLSFYVLEGGDDAGETGVRTLDEDDESEKKE